MKTYIFKWTKFIPLRIEKTRYKLPAYVSTNRSLHLPENITYFTDDKMGVDILKFKKMYLETEKNEQIEHFHYGITIEKIPISKMCTKSE